MTEDGRGETDAWLVLIDCENLGLTYRRPRLLFEVLDACGADPRAGDLVLAFGGHGFNENLQRFLRFAGVEARPLPWLAGHQGLKNGADIAMTVEAVDRVLSEGWFQVALAANDFDFRPLLEWLTRSGRRSLLAHSNPNLSRKLREAAGWAVRIGGSQPGPGRPVGEDPTSPSAVGRLVAYLADALPATVDERVDVLTRLAEQADRGDMDAGAAAAILGFRGGPGSDVVQQLRMPGVFHDAGGLLVEQGGLLHRSGPAREDWVTAAETVWVATVLREALRLADPAGGDEAARIDVYAAAEQYLDDPWGLATAWQLVLFSLSPPGYVRAAKAAGRAGPADAILRRDILRRLHGRVQDLGAGDRSWAVHLQVDPYRLSVAYRATLQDVLADPDVPHPAELAEDEWVAEADARWLAAVVASLPSARRGEAVADLPGYHLSFLAADAAAATAERVAALVQE